MTSFVLLPSAGTAAEVSSRENPTAPRFFSRLADAATTPSWKAGRGAIEESWRGVLGPPPAEAPLKARVAHREREADHDRLLVHYQTEPDTWTDAYLLLPHRRAPRAPAAVVFHGTSSNHILQPVGLADAPTRHLALHLVRRGYVTLSPRCFINGPADTLATTAPATPLRRFDHYTSAAADLARRAPGRTGMAQMLGDGMRAVDYLVSRPEVDPGRIAVLGHSLGAKQVLYLTAFDPRIRAGIASEGGTGIRQSNWDAPWYLGRLAARPDFTRDHEHDELLALIAPRHFLILGGESADGQKTVPLVESARRIFRLYGADDHLVLRLHDRGHDIPADVREAAYDWLDAVMGGTDSKQPVRH